MTPKTNMAYLRFRRKEGSEGTAVCRCSPLPGLGQLGKRAVHASGLHDLEPT